MKVEAVAGVDRLNLFTLVALIGTLAAIGANLGFGWLSDRSVARGDGRRRWLLLGIVSLALSYALFARATSPLGVLLAVVAVQCAANAVLAPLLAYPLGAATALALV